MLALIPGGPALSARHDVSQTGSQDLVALPALDVRGTLTRGRTLSGAIPVVGGDTFAKALVFRFPGYLEPSVAGDQAHASFDLGGRFTRLRLRAGIDDVGWRGDIGPVPIVDGPPPWIPAVPGSPPERDCQYRVDFRVLADRTEVLRTSTYLTPADAPLPVEVDVTGVKTLTLVNVIGPTEACADWYAVWGDPVLTRRPSAAKPRIDYFALGDSIASGHGLMDTGPPCRRSPRSYPYRVKEVLSSRYDVVAYQHKACSGARAGWPQSFGPQSLDYQVDFTLARLSARPTIVSITIGANELEWADIEQLVLHLYDDTWDEFTDFVDSRTTRVETFVAQELGRLLKKPNVAVALTTYFNPFNEKSLFCGFGTSLPPRFDCYARTQYAITKVNASLLRAARRNGTKRVKLVDLRTRFAGHESARKACGLAPPSLDRTWIQDPYGQSWNSNPPIVKALGIGNWRGDCFHPNLKGASEVGTAVGKAAIGLLG